MKHSIRIMAAVFLACSVTLVSAEKAYKWVDKDGKVTYQDQPPPSGAQNVEEKEIESASAAAAPGAEAAAARFPVTLYSAPDCQACDMVRDYLNKRGTPFTEKDVAQDVDNQVEMQQRVGSLTVPTITVGEKIMKGYMQSLLEGELDQAGYPSPAPEEAAETATAQ